MNIKCDGVRVNLDMAAVCKAAEDAATTAENLIKDFLQQGNWSVTLKQDDSPVTEVDIAVEHSIKQILMQALPQAAFYGEETGQQAGGSESKDAEPAGNDNMNSELPPQYRWLVDPIDGTKSFIRGMPFYSTQIALEENGELCIGVSNAPAYSERLVAVRGQGVWLNGKAVQCNDVVELEEAFLSSGNLATLAANAQGWANYAQIVTRVRRVRGYGDFCHYHQLCCGQADLVIESDVNILDIAALTVGVRTAGGVITDITGAPIDENTTSILAACTAQLHAQALAILSEGSAVQTGKG